MSFCYGVSITPLQTLAFYNAIANDGVMVKPRLIKEVRDRDKIIYDYNEPVIQNSVCSKETAGKVREMMRQTVKRGTATNIYNENFSMAGKTGTCLTGYGAGKGGSEYIASFAGYFPAENPEYSCIVVISKPDRSIGYYGNIVAGPVFKTIAQKIYTDTPNVDQIDQQEATNNEVNKDFEKYFAVSQKYKTIVPDVKGLPAMDAVAILENLGLQVKLNGSGKIKKQSIQKGEKVKPNQQILISSI